MISNHTIRKHGLDSKSLKKYFTAKDPDKNVVRLTQLIADRIRDGRTRALNDYKTWAAVDFAIDVPFAQTTPTILRGIMDGCSAATNPSNAMFEALHGWGLPASCLFTKREIEGGGSKWELNEPVFDKIFLPVVGTYLKTRVSKLFNDRNLTPLLEYPPSEFTAENRLLCRILTSVVESVATNFGWDSVLRDWIFNSMAYSVGIKFPIEGWTQYMQENDAGEEVIEKEGIRYAIPHITRMYYDMSYPAHTFNTGTGASYAGYWTIMKWGDVAMDETLWNRTNVPHGTNWLDPNQTWHNYFKEVYPCTLAFPIPRTSRTTDRENIAYRYNRTDFDSACFLTYHFQELVPADWGLGDYKYKVWMRFTIGGDDTVMFAEVLNNRPLDYIGYDADSGRGKNASLALEIIPFQDAVANAYNNMLLTAKRNLANIVFYDTDTVDATQLSKLKVRINDMYTGITFIGYSSLAMENSGNSIDRLLKTVTFPFADINQSLLCVNTTFAILERMLGMSAQEIGSAASHQQSKKEVEITSSSASNRLAYTGSFVDAGVDAWKRGAAESIIANMDGNEVAATIRVDDIPNWQEALQKIGFKFAGQAPVAGERHATVKGTVGSLKLVQFVARRSDAVRQNDSSTAQIMMQTLQSIANSQILSSQVDPASLVEGMVEAAKLAGADDDFKIRLNTDAVMASQLQKLVEQIQQQIMGAVEKEIAAPAAQAIAGVKQSCDQNAQQSAQAIAQLSATLQQIKQMIAPPQMPPMPPNPAAPPAPAV